jgi:hypothetical protein
MPASHARSGSRTVLRGGDGADAIPAPVAVTSSAGPGAFVDGLIVIVTTLAAFGFIFYVRSGTDTASVAGNSSGVELDGSG